MSFPVTIHRRGGPVLVGGEQAHDDYGNPRYSEPSDVQSAAIRVSPVRGEEISIDRQTHTVDYRAAFPPDAEIPNPTDELTFLLSGYRPVRCRVLGVFPVPCPRTNRVKYVRADLEAVT